MVDPGPPPEVTATRLAEETIERIDIGALIEAMEAAPVAVATAPEASDRLEVRVVGESGVGLPGAHLVLENLATGAVWRTLSGAGGRAFFAGIPPGPYRLRAELAGWAAGEGLAMEVGESSPPSVELRLPRAPRQGLGIAGAIIVAV